MSVSQFFIVTSQGDTVVFRDFRGELARETPDIFYEQVNKNKEGAHKVEPVFICDGIVYAHQKSGEKLHFVFTTVDGSASLGGTVELLERLVSTIKDYLGILTEESVNKNHVLVYEIVDEIVDYGFPQGISTELLRNFIHNAPVLTGELAKRIKKTSATIENKASLQPISSHENAHSPGSGKRNEYFLDIVESIVGVFNSKGKCLRANIFGRVSLKNYIAGSPKLRLAFNNDIKVGKTGHTYNTLAMDDCVFNAICDISKWEEDNNILFEAPSGEFRVMEYRMTMDNFYPPLSILTSVQESSNGYIVVLIKLSADLQPDRKIVHINLSIPLPKGTLTIATESGSSFPHELYSASKGKKEQLSFDEAQNCARWKDIKLTGGEDILLPLRITLKSGEYIGRRIKEIKRVMVSFEAPLYLASGLSVKSLRLVENIGTPPQKWIRYMTNTKSYIQRL